MNITAIQLKAGISCTDQRAQLWVPSINQTFQVFEQVFRNKTDVAMFLANVAHETGALTYMSEIWGPTAAQIQYEPITAKSKALGNTLPGDGKRFRGHGPFQITGRYNHARARDGLRNYISAVPDFEVEPELLGTPPWGMLSAGLFVVEHGLQAAANANDFDWYCDLINKGRHTPAIGDTNGYPERLHYYTMLQGVL